jgi:hypothetical protein
MNGRNAPEQDAHEDIELANVGKPGPPPPELVDDERDDCQRRRPSDYPGHLFGIGLLEPLLHHNLTATGDTGEDPGRVTG